MAYVRPIAIAIAMPTVAGSTADAADAGVGSVAAGMVVVGAVVVTVGIVALDGIEGVVALDAADDVTVGVGVATVVGTGVETTAPLEDIVLGVGVGDTAVLVNSPTSGSPLKLKET